VRSGLCLQAPTTSWQCSRSAFYTQVSILLTTLSHFCSAQRYHVEHSATASTVDAWRVSNYTEVIRTVIVPSSMPSRLLVDGSLSAHTGRQNCGNDYRRYMVTRDMRRTVYRDVWRLGAGHLSKVGLDCLAIYNSQKKILLPPFQRPRPYQMRTTTSVRKSDTVRARNRNSRQNLAR
jgi:hypothetical protein